MILFAGNLFYFQDVDVHTLWVRGHACASRNSKKGTHPLGDTIPPAAGTQTKLHRSAVPVFTAREGLVGGVEVNRLHQLGPDAGALCHNTLHTHQGT